MPCVQYLGYVSYALTCTVDDTRAAALTGTILPTSNLTSSGVVTTAAMVLTDVISTATVAQVQSEQTGQTLV